MEESSNNKDERLCGICTTKRSKYCCPRCEIFYCSLVCYQSVKHSECSESFYEDCVNEELSSYHAGDEAKRKMIDILKRVQNDIDEEDYNEIEESIDSDDDEAIDLHERIKDLDLNNAEALWNALTEDEKNEFEAVVRGNVSSVVPQWEPWWMYNKDGKLVEEVQSSKVDEHLKKCPCIKSVPKFNTLTNVKPSTAISFNITNVLASYAFVLRYFNGEIDAIETVAHILDVCQNLSSNTNFDDLETSVESVAQKCIQSELIETDETSLEVMKHDTFLLLKGPSKDNNAYYCKAALSHLIEIFNQAKSNLKTTTKENVSKPEGTFCKKFPENMEYLPKLDLSTVKKNVKKLEFYLSFIQNNDNS